MYTDYDPLYQNSSDNSLKNLCEVLPKDRKLFTVLLVSPYTVTKSKVELIFLKFGTKESTPWLVISRLKYIPFGRD